MDPEETSYGWRTNFLGGVTMWVYLVVAVVVAVVAVAMAPRAPEPPPASLRDIEAPTAEEGRPIPVVFGTYVVKSPNIVWYGDLAYRKIKSKGGK